MHRKSYYVCNDLVVYIECSDQSWKTEDQLVVACHCIFTFIFLTYFTGQVKITNPKYIFFSFIITVHLSEWSRCSFELFRLAVRPYREVTHFWDLIG